ncbi:YslB family protein [Sporolactobacillus shoreicorticis]|uniref:YslB family protein n=1 Tax=Sporolactobacillus shoreicorticis TaxID=1923877 RepID=A0ABW5RZM1_9BACL|nr:YslB family protein [Sporolactobacillus shoreicorticis]MCO7124779.1 YslB family protein [Sporolactobacillus shoreicorticis]
MTRGKTCPQPEHYGYATVPAFGYELIRNLLIPELLGKETASILYWSGRKIARQYPLDNEQQIIDFFDRAGWGQLKQVAKAKNKLTFECDSPIVESRINDYPDSGSFSLEAGFIAEQIQRQTGCIAESYMETKTGRQKKVIFLIKWDAKDPVGTANQ